MRGQECLAARGRPAVDGDLNQSFCDLVNRYTAGHRSIRVNAQFLEAAESRKDSKSQNASCLPIKPGSAPRVAPRQLRNGALKRHHELIGTCKVCVHILRAEHLSPRFKTLLE